MDAETEFLSGLIELQYGLDVKDKLKSFSNQVHWARGWPENKKAFWNAEAFMWQHKIGKDKRELIRKELKFLEDENKINLDLGCGAYSYIKSVGYDVSEKMLQFNDNCLRKVVGDLEQNLPFQNGEFDSITAVFVFNYIHNYGLLLSEIKRILKSKSMLIIILSSTGINQWQEKKVNNKLNCNEWKNILQSHGFDVNFYEKEKLWFFKCQKLAGP